MANHTKPPTRPNSKHTKKAKRDRAAKRERRHPFWRIMGYLSLTVSALVIVAIGAGAGYAAAMLKDLPKITPGQIANHSAPSVIYDKNGQVIGKFSADGDRQPITSVKQVTPNLIQAFVSAEDKTFYTNIGINPLAMGRAFVDDVLGHRIQSGASTITQQTIKLAIFPDQQRTLKRKIQEIALAIEANKMLTKDEIMKDYMNWVYMGIMGHVPVYGVKTASEIMFHKNPMNLTLAESAFIAAIPNNPSLFSPYQFPKNTVIREHLILSHMLTNGAITQSQYDAAMKVDVLKELKNPQLSTGLKYPYLVKDDIEPLVDKYLVQSGRYKTVQDADKALPTAGFKIYTTIDLSKQNDINNVLHDQKLFAHTDQYVYDANGHRVLDKNGKPKIDMYEAGVTLIDNKTGGILAIGGGRDYTKDYYDHSDIARQPGSAIKPLLDYGPALDLHKLTAASPIMDAPVKFPLANGKVWKPVDDVPWWHGIVTARTALYESLNVPAIKVLKLVTPEVGGTYLEKLGITPESTTITGHPTLSASDLQQLSSAIGGLKNGVTVQQMTSAYTVFPNQGIYRQSFLVQKIDDSQGSVLYTAHPIQRKVFSPQTSYIMDSILHDVVYKPLGTAYLIGQNFPGDYISGKTGTTDSQKDGWFVGYTQKYTMGIWMGYNDHQRIPSQAYNLKFALWSKMIAPILQQSPPKTNFPEPTGIVKVAVCDKSGELPTNLCTAQNDVYDELFIQGTEPTTSCTVHVQALYTVVNGKKYLATTMTPPNEVKLGTFLNPISPPPAGTKTLDSADYIPTQPDPRGGNILQGATTGPIQTVQAPSGVQASLNGIQVQLSWNSVSGANSYTVWRATSVNGPYHNIAGPMTTTSYTDVITPSDGIVYYEIYAMSNTGISPPSTPVAVQVGGQGSVGYAGGNSSNPSGTINATGLPDIIYSEGGQTSRQLP